MIGTKRVLLIVIANDLFLDISGPDPVPDVTSSNQINNNTETGLSEVFSHIRDSKFICSSHQVVNICDKLYSI